MSRQVMGVTWPYSLLLSGFHLLQRLLSGACAWLACAAQTYWSFVGSSGRGTAGLDKLQACGLQNFVQLYFRARYSVDGIAALNRFFRMHHSFYTDFALALDLSLILSFSDGGG